MPRIEIVSAKPRVVEEQIVVDVEATLYQEKEGDPDGGMRIPNITFEVRSSVANATGISSQKGYFAQKDILINTCEDEEQEAATAKLTISANYTEGDESKQVIEEITVDISEQLTAINGIKRARKEKEAARLAKEASTRQQKEKEDERKRLKQEMYERMEPDKKRQIKADITKAGEYIKNRERSQIDPFNVLREHEDHPHAERTAIMVAAEAAERTVGAVEIFKSATWASKVMEIAAKNQPLLAIKNVAKYKDMYWAPEVLKIAAQRHPHEVVKALSLYCEYEWCKDVILHIAEIAPQAAFEEVEMWEFYPWAEEAAMAAANKAPEFTINNFSLYQDQPWAQRVYESVAVSGRIPDAEKAEVQRLLKKKITEAGTRLLKKPTNEDFAILYEHRFHPHSKVMMMNVAEKNPYACIEAVRVYKSAQWAKEVMLLAAAKSPLSAISEIDEYIEMEWAKDVMEKAASLRPKESIHALPKYAEYGWGKAIVESIATSSPDSVFEEMEFIEYQSWAEEVVCKAATGKPEKALSLRSGYESQPWAQNIVRGIEDRKQKEQALVLQRSGEARTREQALERQRAEEARIQEQALERKRAEEARTQEQALERKRAEEARTQEQELEKNRQYWAQQALRTRELQVREKEMNRRKFLFGILGLTGATFGGYHVYKWMKSPDYEKLLEGINIKDVDEDPDEILPEDIRTILTDENLRKLFGDWQLGALFDKHDNGSYKYVYPPNIIRMMEEIMNGYCTPGCESYRALFNDKKKWVDYKLDATLVSDGIVTMNLRIQAYHYEYRDGYTTGFLFKDYHPSRSWRAEDGEIVIPDWLTMQVDKTGEDNSLEVKITLKQTQLRPISESVEFVLDRGDISNVVHHAEIQYAYIGTHKSKVIHPPEGQAAIKEKRRQREVSKRIGK